MCFGEEGRDTACRKSPPKHLHRTPSTKLYSHRSDRSELNWQEAATKGGGGEVGGQCPAGWSPVSESIFVKFILLVDWRSDWDQLKDEKTPGAEIFQEEPKQETIKKKKHSGKNKNSGGGGCLWRLAHRQRISSGES